MLPYDAVVSHQVGTDHYDQWVELFRRVLPDSTSLILDVCTGTAFAASIAAALGHRVVAIDLAPVMLRLARRTADTRGLSLWVVQADAVMPSFRPGTFDTITCRHGLWTLREPERALRHWHDLLAPEGRVVVLDSFRSWDAPDPQSERDNFFYRYYTPEVRAATSLMHVKDDLGLREVIQAAGFTNVSLERLPQVFGDGSGEPYLMLADR